MDDENNKQTHKKTYDWLKPHQFQIGNPGGPGRPKGPTLKSWLKDKFAEMTDEERIEFLNQIEPIKAWEMGEGKAETKAENKLEVTLPTPLLAHVSTDESTEENTEPEEKD